MPLNLSNLLLAKDQNDSHGRSGKQDNYIGDGLISMIEYDLKPGQTILKEFKC